MENRFDDLLYTVISEKGQGIHGFFDVMMGFMYRRTDFFYEMAPGENMGFFPGQAEAMLYNYYRKYQNLHYKERVPKRDIDPKEIQKFLEEQKLSSKSKTEIKSEIKKENKVEKVKEVVKEEINKLDKNNEIKKLEVDEINKSDTIDKKDKNESIENKNSNQNKFSSISTYNGDECDMYNWSQGSKDVQIQIKLPPNTSAKKLNVTFTSTHVKVIFKEDNSIYFEGEFSNKIKIDDSYWLVEESSSLILYLDKLTEVIWSSAFKGHKEIDTKKVDNSKRIDEFDSETQSALNKIVYEQNRKKYGLPTTEEEKKLEQLKKAWEAPDSPFYGQPFDPSQFNLNEPIYFNTPDYENKLKMEKLKKEQDSMNK